MAELQHPIPHSVSRPSLMSYDDSLPVAFPSESSLQVEPAYPTPSEHLMVSGLMLQWCYSISILSRL